MGSPIIKKLKAKAAKDGIKGLEYVQMLKAAKEVISQNYRLEVEQIELEIEVETEKAVARKLNQKRTNRNNQ